MASSCGFSCCRFGSRRVLCSLAAIAAVSSLVSNRAFGAANETSKAEAERLVATAMQAEINGDIARSFTLLHDAVRVDPDNRLARAQLGEVKVDGKWTTIEEAQRRAAADPLQNEYYERRKAAGQSAQGQLTLARWCRKNNLNEEAEFHWSNVLCLDPKNEEALHALDLRWQKGRLVSRTQIVQDKDQLKEAKRASERWASKLVKWRRAVTGYDAAARDVALSEIRSIGANDAIPSLEDVTLGRDVNDPHHADECQAIALAFVDALEKMQGQPATVSLARHAVFAPGDKVRALAIAKLKPRDQHDFVPMLVDGLGMPIESSFSLTTGPDGSVHYLRSLYREGPESDWSWESRRQAVQHDLGGRNVIYDTYTGKVNADLPTESAVVVASKKTAVAAKYQSKYRDDAVVTEQKIANANQTIETINARIVPVLVGTTGKDFGDNPKAWWDWWRTQNEYYASDHPVNRGYDAKVDHYTYGLPSKSLVSSAPPPPPVKYSSHSCFAKGTLVWTKTGTRPIETIENGDLVLAQDVNTGELKYRPVIGRTVRPPSPIVKISFAKEDVLATKGHPFWITGVGWRMAKEVADGDVLHGVSGSSTIRSVKTVGEAEAYNLIVADFNTYFVGESGILVHDNTPRNPTQAIMPGYLATK
jgi:hypothetical protein